MFLSPFDFALPQTVRRTKHDKTEWVSRTRVAISVGNLRIIYRINIKRKHINIKP